MVFSSCQVTQIQFATGYTVKNCNIIPGFPWNFTCLIPEKHNGWYWKILHIAQKGLFLYPARKNVPGPAGVLSYQARERNILPKARSWKFSGRFRAGEQIQVRAAPPPPQTQAREKFRKHQSPYWMELLRSKCVVACDEN